MMRYERDDMVGEIPESMLFLKGCKGPVELSEEGGYLGAINKTPKLQECEPDEWEGSGDQGGI